MTQTNFAEINTMVDETLDSAKPNIAPVFKSIAGFIIPDEKAQNERTLQQHTRIENHRNARSSFIVDLQKIDVTPLAVIPSKAWEQICRESRLYRFAPSYQGSVGVSTRDYAIFSGVAVFLSLLLWIGPPIVTIIAMIQMQWGEHHPTFLNWVAMTTLAGMGVAHFIMIVCDGEVYIIVHNWLAKLCSRIYNIMPRKWVWRRLFPGMTGGTDRASQIILPTPPAEIAAILERARSLQLQVAVVPEAFDIQDRPSDLFARRINKDSEIRRLRAFADRFADPIIYTERHGMVAVIAQFGDFVIERETVERAMDCEDYLL